MNALSNAETREGNALNSCARFAPGALPQAVSASSGVSVDYVRTRRSKWFVFRASYGRQDRAADLLIADGTYAYIGKRYTRKLVNGKQTRVLEPLMPNLLFAYTTARKAEQYVKETPSLHFLSYYYDHFTQNEKGHNPPLTIACQEMENFILATSSGNEHLRWVKEAQCRFKGGENVRVLEGAFKGVEGRVARVAGQQRVVVTLKNLGMIATAYIPSAFLAIIHEHD